MRKLRTGTPQPELWSTKDIARYCGISYEKADKLHMIANKACNVVGYGDIRKDVFLEFLDEVKAERESRRLQDEANAAQIIYAQRNHNLNWLSNIIQAVGLLAK